MVRTHPATGRRSLYLGRHASHVVGLPESEGRALIERVNAWAVEPPRTFTHHWAKGDVVIWDNRCVLHRGHDWPLEEPRVMNRTTIAGDADVASNEWSLDA
jgi:alpha-ketoglutarate-dependent taurine dioxygenase